MDLPTVAALLGHSRLDTVRIYAQLDETALERAAATLVGRHDDDAGRHGEPRVEQREFTCEEPGTRGTRHPRPGRLATVAEPSP